MSIRTDYSIICDWNIAVPTGVVHCHNRLATHQSHAVTACEIATAKGWRASPLLHEPDYCPEHVELAGVWAW